MKTLTSRNPADGSLLAELVPTTPDQVIQAFDRARAAQRAWGALPLSARAKTLLQLREVIIQHTDEIVELITQENGKPYFEALANEVIPSVDMLTFFAKKAPYALRDTNLPLSIMKHRQSTLNYWPLGVVTIISPWNYPWLLPLGEIMMALVAGNAVIFKPSEITPLIGLKIQAMCDLAGFPTHLLQTLLGDGILGSQIIAQRPNKIFFTGSVATGKIIMAQAAEYLIPVNLELGGKDPIIVLADADLDFATSATLWGGYTNAGQMCASVERVLVHESIVQPFTTLLSKKTALLRQGPSHSRSNDLGPITLEKQKKIYDSQLQEAKAAGITICAGGQFSEDRRFLQPTLLAGKALETLSVYQEETFGPVLPITTFRSIPEAIEKANNNRYGLLASVITRDLALGEQIARQIQAGSVLINEVCYTAGLGETPWGGLKDSGIGRSHSLEGLKDFVNIRHIHKPRAPWLTFKSLWWFPYTDIQYRTFRLFLELYRCSWLKKLAAFPHFLSAAIRLIKNDKRL